MLFAKADRKNCTAIKDVLDSFCELSGQKISSDKSRVFFSPNMTAEDRLDLCEILGFRSTPSLGKYLGFPIKHTGTPQDFGFILERIQGKLAGWKANLLSFAGRTILTRSVTSTIPNYVMQCSALPAKILQGIDRLSRNFLWGSSKTKKKFHLIGWEKITKSRDEGGLGIHAAKPKNTALLAKLNWRFNTEKSSLWVRVLTHKYRPRRGLSHATSNCTSCSPTWTALRKGQNTFNKGSKWIAGSNSGLSLWHDKWLNKGTLRSLIYGPLNKGEDHVKLLDVASFFGWNMDNISFVFPNQILLEMKATPIPCLNHGVDRLCWHSSPSGEFKLKDAYRLVLEEKDFGNSPSFKGKWVWKVWTIPKVQNFLWQCCHLSIPVRSLLCERGMNLNSICPVCNAGTETIVHSLRDCPMAKSFWNSFNPPIHPNLFYGTNILDWLRLNCQCLRG